MTRTAIKASRFRAATAFTLGRQFLALAALVAFLLQSMAVQTHVHPAGPQRFGPETPVALAMPAQGLLKNLQTDPGACRLCQEMAFAGTYIAPAVILPAALLAVTIWRLVVEDHVPQFTAPSFIWQSRGPPSH